MLATPSPFSNGLILMNNGQQNSFMGQYPMAYFARKNSKNEESKEATEKDAQPKKKTSTKKTAAKEETIESINK